MSSEPVREPNREPIARVWLVGKFPPRPNFGDVVCRVVESSEIADISHDRPDVIVFHQEHVASVPRETVELWRSRYPFARLCLAVGHWSEGEARTGHPLPGMERVRWAELPAYLNAAGFRPHLPPTSTLAERIAAPISPALLDRFRGVPTVVVATRSETRRTYVELAEAIGLVVAESTKASSPRLILWADGDLEEEASRRSLAAARAAFPDAGVIAILPYVREQDVAAFTARYGIDAVVLTPVQLDRFVGGVALALSKVGSASSVSNVGYASSVSKNEVGRK